MHKKREEKLASKVGKININEIMGFHGTRNTHPDKIIYHD